jgi:hypothetical protein
MQRKKEGLKKRLSVQKHGAPSTKSKKSRGEITHLFTVEEFRKLNPTMSWQRRIG